MITKVKKKQIHLRLKESTVNSLQNYANKRGIPMNIAADELLEVSLNGKTK